MSTLLRVSRGAIEKFQRYNEDGCLCEELWYSGRNHRSANLPASPSRSDITAENICNEESLLETCVEESFLSGINFFIVLISFRRTLQSISCACFLCHRLCIFFSSPSSLSFCLLLLIPTLFPEAVAICTMSQD